MRRLQESSGALRLRLAIRENRRSQGLLRTVRSFMQAMSYTGHQFSGAIRNGILPVADMTSHLPVVRLHGLEQEVLFLLQSKASHNQASTSVFSDF